MKTPDEVALLKGVTPEAVVNAIGEGRLKATRRGRRFEIADEDADQWVVRKIDFSHRRQRLLYQMRRLRKRPAQFDELDWWLLQLYAVDQVPLHHLWPLVSVRYKRYSSLETRLSRMLREMEGISS